MVIHGNAWQYMGIDDNTWLYMVIHGNIHGNTWQYMAIYGYTG